LFTLKRGVAFTDGTPFNGAAVARNIERMYQVSPRGGFFTLNAPQQWGPVAGVDVLDDHTVRVRHSSPFPVLDRTAAGFFSAMFSPQSFQPNGDFAGIPSTTGPFRFVDWERDQWYRVVRNEGFQGTAPRVREVLWRLIPDANSRVAALQARQVDGIVELGAISVAQAEDLKRRPDVVVGAEPIALTQWIFFNTAKPPFDDKRLRQAVARWLDRTAMVRDLSFGYGVTDTGVLSSLSARWFSPRGVFQRNPQQAQALAQAALGGRRVEVDLPYVATPGNSRSHKETVDYLGAVLAPLGLDVKPRPLENAAMTAAQTRGEFNLRLQNGFGWVSGDPDQRFRSTLHSRGTAQATWGGGYNNPEADALIDRAVTLRDLDARKAIYDDLQALSVEEAPFVVIYDEISPYAHAPHIIDLGLLPNYRPTVEQMAVAVRA
jgi:peptide/nickel transport system substrate-binding protein